MKTSSCSAILSDLHFTWSLCIICKDALSSALRPPTRTCPLSGTQEQWPAEGKEEGELRSAERNSQKLLFYCKNNCCLAQSSLSQIFLRGLFFSYLTCRIPAMLRQLIIAPMLLIHSLTSSLGGLLACSLCLLLNPGGCLRHRASLAACWAPSLPTSKGGLRWGLCVPRFCAPEPGQAADRSSCTRASATQGCQTVSHTRWTGPRHAPLLQTQQW